MARFLSSFVVLIVFVLFLSGYSFATNVVLIPGTAHRFVPKIYPGSDLYYGSTAIRMFTQAGYKVFVAHSLSSMGDLTSNGVRLTEELRQIYSHYPEPMILVGHSAGTFAGLYAMGQLKNLIPFKGLVALSTPFHGTELADKIFEKGTETWQKICDIDSDFFNCEGLIQMRSDRVSAFLAANKFPSQIPLYVVRSYQNFPPLWKIGNAKFLSPYFIPTTFIIDKTSDGIVSYESADATTLNLLDEKNSPVKIIPVETKVLLDHYKQIFDYRFYQDFGTRDFEYIEESQITFYAEIIKALKASH